MLRILIILFILNSCSYPKLIRDELVYDNDFELKSTDKIDGAGFTIFNNSTVLGNFNNDGFILHLGDVGDHDYIFVSFDLYIHGSWDGNFNGFSENDKPDLWILEYKPEMNLHKDLSIDKFETTFSNSPCYSNYCLRQSYPEKYPFFNNPKTGSFKTDLEEICENNFFGGKSTLYKIEKSFRSRGNAIVLKFHDKLYQPNAIDKNGVVQSKCDESWSLDNLKVRVLSYK